MSAEPIPRRARPCLYPLLATALVLGLACSACSSRATSGPTRPPQNDTRPLSSQATDATPRGQVESLTREILDDWFYRSPVFATSIGIHDYDGRWPDLSPDATRAEVVWIAASRSRLAALREALVARRELTPVLDVDLSMLDTRLENAAFELVTERVWWRNPLAWTSLVGGGLDLLVSRETRSLELRARDLSWRLQGVPELLAQARSALADPTQVMQPHTKVAIGQLVGLRELLEHEIPKRFAALPPDALERLKAPIPDALAAIAEFEQHLTQLLPSASGDWRAGASAFQEKLRLTLETEMKAADLLQAARAEHERVTQRMAGIARSLYPALYGYASYKARVEDNAKRRTKPQDVDTILYGDGKAGAVASAPPEKTGKKPKRKGADAESDAEIIRAVLDGLATIHPSEEGLREAAEENLSRLIRFVDDEKIVTQNASERLDVIWTPAHQRGVAIAGLDAPPPLDATAPGLPSFYLVQPLPAEWTAERKESFLREYNSFMLEILSIHEAIPGHFVQLYFAKGADSTVRKIFSNGAFVEGWAVYAESVMMSKGYNGVVLKVPTGLDEDLERGLKMIVTSDDTRMMALELHALKFYLRAVTNSILDHEIQAGSMDEAAAVKFMVEESFQEEGEARAKWIRAQLSATQLSTYFVGLTQWKELRSQAEHRGGFSMRRFHDQALSFGAPPVGRLPELMGWKEALSPP